MRKTYHNRFHLYNSSAGVALKCARRLLLDRVWLLVLGVFCSIACCAEGDHHHLEVKQRKGNMYVKLHDYNVADTIPLVCIIQGSGNNIEADFDPKKVLKISGDLLKRGKAIISIRAKETDQVIARCDTVVSLSNATLELPNVTIQGAKRPIKSLVSHRMGHPSFMITESNPKLKRFKDLDVLLRNAGVKNEAGDYGKRYLFANVVIVNAKGEIEKVPPVSIEPSDVKQIDIYKTPRTDPDVVVIQLKHSRLY